MDFSVGEIAKISTLFLSKDDNSTVLAFEMMRGRNASKVLLTELFAVYKLSTDKSFKATARQEIARLANQETIGLLDAKKKLSRSSNFDPNEKTIAKNIRYYVDGSKGDLDGTKLAYALIEKYGHGYEYLINNLTSPQLIDFFSQFCTGKRFEFSKKGIGKIPKEVFLIPQAEQIEEFDMSGNKIVTLPAGIAKFKNLKKINLSSNNLKSINKAIGKLNQLEYLDLSHNNFKLFPKAILACPLVEFRGSHMASYFSRAFDLPEDFKQLETLRVLHLHRSNKHSLISIHQILAQCTHLEKLILSAHQETTEQINHLKDILPNCSISTDHLLNTLNNN